MTDTFGSMSEKAFFILSRRLVPVDLASPEPYEDTSFVLVSSFADSNAFFAMPIIFCMKSAMVDAVFLKKYSFTTMYGTRLSMSSMDLIASNDAGVMAIYGQVSLASFGLNEYIVHHPLFGPYGLNSCWSPSCIKNFKPLVISDFMLFHPISLFLSGVVFMSLLEDG